MPIVFPLVMAFGGFLGLTGVPLPGIEIGIALSAVVLGLMVASAARPPLWVAAVLVGGFAIFHGHAHGTELPGAADPLAYSLGFVLATGLMHAGGITFGLLSRWPGGSWAVRACGRPDRPGRSELPDGCGLLKPSRHAGFGLLLALPVMAWAHSPVPGLGRFYNGMLHPVLAPAALIALVALGLPLGQRGLGPRPPARSGVPAGGSPGLGRGGLAMARA